MDDRRLTEWAGQDLAQLATEWDRATTLLEPGRERRWTQRVPTPEQQQAAAEQHRADRLAAFEAARAGVKTLPASAAPVDLRVVEAMQQAGWAVTELAGEIRARLGLPPLFAYDVIPASPPTTDVAPRHVEVGTCSGCGSAAARPLDDRRLTGRWWHAGSTECVAMGGPVPKFVPRKGVSGPALDRIDVPGVTEADARFSAARRWLANSGIHATPADLLEHAAAEIRRALRLLTAVTSDQQYTRVITAPCPACQRLSLRAHLDSASVRDWLVQCHAQDCRARWEYDQWGDLGGTIGVDVFAAVAGDSAA